MSDTLPLPVTGPSRARAFACLLLNIIVFPGLGTLVSGDPTRKRTGKFQFGLGLLLIPFLVLASLGTVMVAGVDADTVKAWVGNFMLLLVLWNVITGLQIFRDAWRNSNERSHQKVP